MFAFAAVLLSAAAIAVTVLPYVFHSRRWLAVLLCVNLLLCIAGIGCLAGSVFLSRQTLAGAGSDAEFCGWASDMLSVWRYTGGTFAAAVGGITLLAALIRHRMRWVRSAVMAAVSVLLWFLGGAYALTCETPLADLVTPVHLWTAGCALVILAGAAVDAARALYGAKKK